MHIRLTALASGALLFATTLPVLAQDYYPPPLSARRAAALAIPAFPSVTGASDYYRMNPREDPEPFRCLYAADAGCPGRTASGFTGDPREDPEPFRCLYAADADCSGYAGLSGIR